MAPVFAFQEISHHQVTVLHTHFTSTRLTQCSVDNDGRKDLDERNLEIEEGWMTYRLAYFKAWRLELGLCRQYYYIDCWLGPPDRLFWHADITKYVLNNESERFKKKSYHYSSYWPLLTRRRERDWLQCLWGEAWEILITWNFLTLKIRLRLRSSISSICIHPGIIDTHRHHHGRPGIQQ